MATGGLYGSSMAGASLAKPSAESNGLYGGPSTNFGGTYFEWFVFQVADTQPATPTGGSWDFQTNTGTPPSGWSLNIPTAPAETVWVSIALVNSRDTSALTWSAPGLFGNFTNIQVGTTTTGAAGTSAAVTNSGTNTNVVLNFTIPRGNTGDPGPTGDAATIAVGTTTTTNPGTSAAVTNSGDSHNAVFNFQIPRGAGVNSGGTTGQVLAKASSTDYDTTWLSITGNLSYQGTWNASTNTPTLTSSVGTNGYYYVVNVAGTTNLNGITDWQVGDWALFNGSAWQKIDQSWAQAGNNNDITSLSGITGGISSPTFLQLQTAITPSPAVGKLQWDTTWGGPQIGMEGGNVNLQIGQETLIKVYNNTGSSLTDGQVVYVTGSQGQRLTVALAKADSDATSAAIIGMVTEPIANNSSGFVTTQGMVNAINTSGAADGDVVYLSPTTAGGWTTTKPVAPQHMVMVGYVVKGGSAGAGSIYVNTQNGYELEELHNVLITSPTSGNTLIYDASVGVWKNANLTAGSGISITNGAGSIQISSSGVSTFSAGTTGFTPNTATGGAVTLAGTLNVANGGTGATTVAGAQTNLQVDPAGTAVAMAIALG